MLKPDYDHSIVNLMASIAQGLGAGDTGYAPLTALPPDTLRDRPVALLLVDGLGTALLQKFPDSHLARAHTGRYMWLRVATIRPFALSSQWPFLIRRGYAGKQKKT